MKTVITEGYQNGWLSGMVGLHMAYYGPAWGFGRELEAKLSGEAAHFLSEYQPGLDLILIAREGDAMVGTISIDGTERDGPGSHLRWFIVSDQARGTGLGRRLIDQALAFCDASPRPLTWLTTFRGLDAAARLYSATGFALASESEVDQWQGGVVEQRFERRVPS